jgi:mono/diheme cytochrome c family protein
MTPTSRSLFALIVLCGMTVGMAALKTPQRLVLQLARQASSDLEIGGSLQGVPQGQTRFVSYQSLLSLPQETYTVTDDSNFGQTQQITGIPLAELPTLLGAQAGASMVIAICDDNYAAHYPASYVSAHHPLLVLKVNGLKPDHWPLGVDQLPMGPYMVSHPSYKPSFRVLSHDDEAQVPWGIVRLDLRREQEVYAPIQPQGASANDTVVQQGYAIARQNCFRCHNRSGEGGQKSSYSWGHLAHKAVTDPTFFNAYVRTPKQLNAQSQMAASPQYDDATLSALRRYFASFVETAR